MKTLILDEVRFAYNKNAAVLEGLSMEVPKGSIYGFLGANGAGKTTTLRLILGLLQTSGGKISVWGEDIKTAFPKKLRSLGSLIEEASLYGHLSARDNLRIWCKYFKVPTTRIEEVLDLVDLSKHSKKQTLYFSTGMKQRLCLATALLHDPELLILDEPTNGLDPMGIIDLRKTLHRLQAEGKTILLSSHILAEVEKIVSMIGIIKDGKIVFEGTMAKLMDMRQRNISYKLQLSDAERAINLLSTPLPIKREDEYLYVKTAVKQDISLIIKSLVEQGIDIYEVMPLQDDLEQLFLSINQKK